MGAIVAAGLVLVACGGDDAAGTEPTSIEVSEAFEESEESEEPSEVETDGAGSVDAVEVTAAWTAVSDAYEAIDRDDPFAEEFTEEFLATVTAAVGLLPASLPVPATPNPMFGYGTQADQACVAQRRFDLDLVDATGEGVGGGVDRDGVVSLFEESVHGAWETVVQDEDFTRFHYEHEGVTWQLDLATAWSGDHAVLGFCPLAP